MNNRRRRIAKARRADAQQPVRNGNHIAELLRVRDGLREIYERLNRRVEITTEQTRGIRDTGTDA